MINTLKKLGVFFILTKEEWKRDCHVILKKPMAPDPGMVGDPEQVKVTVMDN